MADATYDAVIVGGGGKGLVVAMYLAKYGGMDVAVFESRHEAGGGWCTDEGPAPGFLADYHASGVSTTYHLPVERDFTQWRELSGGFIPTKVGSGAVFKDDDSCLVTYSRKLDPNQERSAKEIARFSERDAETWLKLYHNLDKLWPAYFEYIHNPPTPPGVPDALERLLMDPNSGFDPVWAVKSPLEVARELFESEAVIAMLMRIAQSLRGTPPDVQAGWDLIPLTLSMCCANTYGLRGGTHQWAHAATKRLASHGGKVLTKCEVDKVIIENGKAVGVRLVDGTEVEARKLVVSALDPYTLCFRLIGKEHLDWRLLRRVENLERRLACLAWYTWAVHDLPQWKAADYNPDINEVSELYLISKDSEALVREHATITLGKLPTDLQLSMILHSIGDKTRSPEGKYAILTEQFVLPANFLTEKEWFEYKKRHAEELVYLWQKHAPNMNWDNIIGYIPLNPYDHCKLANMAPTGDWCVIDNITSQRGRFRPTPELAYYRTPIKDLYATGSGWHAFGGGSSCQAYACYKVIAQDLDLGKPWEKEGQPW